MPEVGSIGATALYTLCQWQTKAIAAATEYALAEGAAQGLAAGIQVGKGVAIKSLKLLGVEYFWPRMSNYIHNMSHYNEVANLTPVIYTHKYKVCVAGVDESVDAMCTQFDINFGVFTPDVKYADLPGNALPKVLNRIVSKAETTAKAFAETESTRIAAEITEQQTAAINATYASWQTPIIASIVAIVVIILVMVIIYLVLRYRRKKKMKKKLQYIKLLEE
ncbi:hypothetical protein PFFCH_01577 [Plasmodium falciparum FCH/4]|uniref:Surface antigen n=1 Tax=Plasmodium falciparum FCH/4 TaxID=1036724 RepID=A0A024VR87_PLAFA|nr:hypothetical protein PFFCH_01577 [Plasmodium falciparum FCH/4]